MGSTPARSTPSEAGSELAFPAPQAVVLAAGHGTRMKSARSKVLFELAGRPMVYYPVRAALDAGAPRVVVVANPHNRDELERYLTGELGAAAVTCVVQDPPRGTGDAVRVALAALDGDDGPVLVVNGDASLLGAAELTALCAALAAAPAALLAFATCTLDDPSGYGRVLRDPGGAVCAIREDRDLASDAERAVGEVNAGLYCIRAAALRELLPTLRPANAQGEYYLTDLVSLSAPRGGAITVLGSADALVGVNDRAQLAAVEDELFRRIARRHALAGVSVKGDARIDDTVTLAVDATVESGVRLRGSTALAAGASVDVGCVVQDAEIGPGARLLPYSVVTRSRVGPNAQVGPFAHLRPGSVLEEDAHVGNFVETKQTHLGRGAKANHLAYLGDGQIGARANIGAGTIFCNYDGFTKHETQIGEDAFIGSDSQLVAPVSVGKGAYVATGTTVTRDVPDDALAIARVSQDNKAGYARRLRATLAARKRRG